MILFYKEIFQVTLLLISLSLNLQWIFCNLSVLSFFFYTTQLTQIFSSKQKLHCCHNTIVQMSDRWGEQHVSGCMTLVIFTCIQHFNWNATKCLLTCWAFALKSYWTPDLRVVFHCLLWLKVSSVNQLWPHSITGKCGEKCTLLHL